MSLQTEIINQFFELNPKLTIKEIASLTKIQTTRIFRILNGFEMKISEYEIFLKAIRSNSQHSPLIETAQQCSQKLSLTRKKELNTHMNHLLSLFSLLPEQSSDLQKISNKRSL